MGYESEVFKLYGPHVADNDSYLDEDGKGLFERFNEVLGAELDDNTVDKLTNLLDNMIVPSTMMEKFRQKLLLEIGFTPVLSLSTAGFTRLMSLMQDIMDSRGLDTCYDILLRLLGLTSVTFTAQGDYTATGFDSSTTLDSNRKFDSSYNKAFYYNVYFTGDADLTDELEEAMKGIVDFNNPYYLIVLRIYYNDELIYLNGVTELYVEDDYIVDDYIEDKFEVNDIFVN